MRPKAPIQSGLFWVAFLFAAAAISVAQLDGDARGFSGILVGCAVMIAFYAGQRSIL